MQARCIYIWGEGKKFYVLTKRVKKNTLLFSWGFSNDLSNQGGKWVILYGVGYLYCDCACWNYYRWVLYIFGGRVKNLMF